MHLPAELREAIDRECSAIPFAALAKGAKTLSDAYRQRERLASPMPEPERLAYAATRMPATYAAISSALNEARLRSNEEIRTAVDLGAGLGSGAWALRGLNSITCIERDPGLLQLGQRLTPFADWRRADVLNATIPEADLILCSYLLGEVDAPSTLITKAWQATRKLLVIIEPGTTKAFTRLAPFRKLNGHLIAPCPHQSACPMEQAGDWCHFAARLERSSLHRRLKEGNLSHEDEKFSYLVLSKQPGANAAGRIVRHPLIEPGRITLNVCATEGLKNVTVRKSAKDDFRSARKSAWGDEWPKPTASDS